jgi:hypothetical protein
MTADKKPTQTKGAVFDIAKPGTATPDTGSKPMIIGHKPLGEDPDVKIPVESEPKNVESEKKVDEAKKAESEPEVEAAEKKKPLQPSEEIVKAAEAINKQDDDQSASDTKQQENEADANDKKTENEEDDEDVIPALAAEKYIKSKEYFLPINQSSSFSWGTFLKTFLAGVLVSIVIVVLLVDADLLDLNIDLPFNFL